MKMLIVLFALSFGTVTHAQTAPEIRSVDEGGGAIGNGGEIKETDLIVIMKKIKSFLRTKQGIKEFPNVSAGSLARMISATRMTIVEGELRDKQNRLRSTRNIDQGNVHLIQFSSSALVALPSREALYALVFHEYLNLMGIELTDEVNLPSIYPTSQKIIAYVAAIEKMTVYPDEQDYSYQLKCNPRLQVETSKKNLFGNWVKKDVSERSACFFGAGMYNRLDRNAQAEMSCSYESSSERYKVQVKPMNQSDSSVEIELRLNGELIGSQVMELPEEFVEKNEVFPLPNEVTLKQDRRNRTAITQVSLSCSILKVFE